MRDEVKAIASMSLHWWLGELAALVPARFHEFVRARSFTITLSLDGSAGEIILDAARGSERLLAFDCSREAIEDVRQSLARCVRRLPRSLRRSSRWHLRLPARAALRTTMTLPAAAEENLQEVVGYELDRHTPFTAGEVYLSCRKRPREPASGQIELDLVVAPRVIADRALALARQIGFEPDDLVVAAEAPDRDVSEPLHVEAGGQAPRKLAKAVPLILAGAAVMLAALVVYLPLWRMHGELEALEQRLPEVSRAAGEAVRLQKEIAALEADGRFVGDRKRLWPPATRILAELTHLLPDDTWLAELQLSGTELQMQGSSASAPAIVALLEQSTLLKGATFRAPTTQDPATGRDRFHISTQLASPAQK